MTYATEFEHALARQVLGAFNLARQGMLISDTDGEIRLANEHFAALVGRPAENLPGARLEQLLHADDRTALRAALVGAGAAVEQQVACRLIAPDESVTHVRLVLSRVAEGAPAIAVLAVESPLAPGLVNLHVGSEAPLLALLDSIPAMVIVTDAAGRANYTNRAWEEFTGLSAGDGLLWMERGYIHPDDVQRATRAWSKARRLGEGYDIDYRVRRRDGEYRWLAFTIRPVHDDDGSVVAWTSAVMDVDDRVRAQEGLIASEARLRALIDADPSMVVVTSAAGEVELVSRRWTEFTGLDAAGTAHWQDIGTIHPEDAEATAEFRRQGLQSLKGYDVDYRMRHHDGSYRWVTASVRPARTADGRVLGWIFVGLDIDDRVRARDRLEALNANLQLLAESIPALVITTPDDPDSPTFANMRWTEYTGIPIEDVTQDTIQRLIHRDDIARVRDTWSQTRDTGEAATIDFRLRRHDGAYRWFTWRTQPLLDATGGHLGWISAGVDIDDQVSAREQLERTNLHLSLLADAGHAIASAVNYETAIDAAARIIVPSFADWCSLDILEGQAFARKVAFLAPGLDAEAGRVLRETPLSLDRPDDFLTSVVLTGEAQFLPVVGGDLSAFRRTNEQFDALTRLQPNSSIAVPLRAGGRTFGVLNVTRMGSRPGFTEQDFATVLELGRRFGSLLDRARLFAQVTRALGNLRLLADAGLTLSGTPDVGESIERAARLLVPTHADWCTVDILEGDKIRRAAVVHAPDRVADATRDLLARSQARPGNSADAVARIIETGEPLFLPQHPADNRTVRDLTPEYNKMMARVRPASSMAVPLRTGDRIFGVLGMVRLDGREPFDEADLSLALEFARQLAGAIERARLVTDLQTALNARNEFFGFVSHELKTPLTTVVGISDVLARRYSELDEGQRSDAIGLIRRDSLRLEEIIANMLTLARSERSTGDEPSLVQHIISASVATHRQRHPERHIEVELEPGLPPVLSPPGWLDRVVENLLSNADKYSETHTPVDVRAARNGQWVEVRVLDRGRGISQEQMEEVFEPFFRADPNESGVPGVGLGLTVCRRLIERLGGQVWLAPRDGGGTEAGFRVPVMDVPED